MARLVCHGSARTNCWINGAQLGDGDRSGQKFFGFSEFLTCLELMVLAWTIVDVRYPFQTWEAVATQV